VRSFLSARRARLRFDGEDTDWIGVTAGVPQGSPLSPILFILYTASLYKELETHAGLATVGFADDLNLLAVARKPGETRDILEKAWGVCETWARTRGMQFAPQKTELMHFTRARAPIQQRVRIGGAEVSPQVVARFLGVWLDRKLRWSAHLGQIRKRLKTQRFALTRLAASTWGCSLHRARMLYTAVIRSAVAYGAAAYHVPAAPKPRGVARSLAREQNRCLRVIAGAFRATPVRNLETETFVPPIDLYLNVRLADFEARLQLTGKAQLIDNVCAGVRAQLRRRRGRPRKQKQPTIEEGAGKLRWAKERMWDGTRGARCEAREALARDWRERWQSDCAAARRRTAHRSSRRASVSRGTRAYGSTKARYSYRCARERSASARSYTSAGCRMC